MSEDWKDWIRCMVIFAIVMPTWMIALDQLCRISAEKNRFVRKIVRPLRENLTILIATTQYRQNLSEFYEFTIPPDCPKQCRVVPHNLVAEELPHANAVVFHIVISDMPWVFLQQALASKHPEQIWVFWSLEPPPILVDMLPNEMKQDFSMLNGVFNWTMTMRSDSDIPIRYYGMPDFVEIPESERSTEGTFWKSTSNKKHIAGVIRNCNSRNYDRLKVLYDLRALGLEADVHGACNPQSPCRDYGSERCAEMIERDYLFYASFENSLCPDYTTEKLQRGLSFNFVPVVIGGGNYSWQAPPNSYINARDFNSVAELADYLKKLAANETDYNRYHQWRSQYRQQPPKHTYACKLCMKLHERREKQDFTPKVYNDFDEWWQRARPCGGDLFLGTK